MNLKQRAIEFLNKKEIKEDINNRVVVREDGVLIFISDLMEEFTNEQIKIEK